MLADLRPADAVALWAGIETAEAHPARMLVGAWLAACAASERSVDLRVRHADAMIVARRMAGIARRDLYRRLLDAGRFMEQEERDEQGLREATASTGTGSTTKTSGPTSGKAASKYAPPTWNDLRGLGAEDRRLVIEYFRRLNGTPPR
jgi:hypothetical protein